MTCSAKNESVVRAEKPGLRPPSGATHIPALVPKGITGDSLIGTSDLAHSSVIIA
jgi:hypothetical protein